MFFLQLRQLVWKNALARSRSKVRLATELIWPLTIFIILALVRTRGLKEYSKECYFEEKALPSSGSLRFYQNVLCTSLNWCYSSPPDFPYLINDNINIQRLNEVLYELNASLEDGDNFQPLFPNITIGANGTIDCNVTLPFSGTYSGVSFIRDEDDTQVSQSISILDIFGDLDETPVGKLANRLEKSRALDSGNISLIDFFSTLCGHNPLPPTPRVLQAQTKTLKWDRSSSRFRYYSTSHRVKSRVSDQCNDIFGAITSDPQTEAIFGYLYPLIRGKLVYSPNTPAFDSLVRKVNESFQDAKQIQDIADQWLEISPRITAALEQISETISNAKDTFENCTQIMSSLEAAEERVNETLVLVAQLDAIASVATIFIDCFEFDRFEGFPTEREALAQGYKLLDANELWAVIVFDSNSTNETFLPQHITYKIRMDKFVIDSTKRVRDYVETPLPRNDPRYGYFKYFTSGFIFLQDRIEQAIVSLQTQRDSVPAMYMQQTPEPCYVFDVFLFSIASSLPLYFNLAFVYTCAMTVKSIVHEKERRLKETMRTMGLSNTVHWVAWFIDSMGVLLAACILLPIIIYFGNVLEKTNPFVLFVLLLSFCIATVCFSFLISTLFSRANLAAASGAFIYFLTYQPCNLIDLGYEGSTFIADLFLSLFSNVAFGIGVAYVTALEELDGGAQWHNIASSPRADDSFSLAACIYMLLFDSVLYLLLTWYIENVRPGQYGIPKPWYFPFQRSYWFSDYSVHHIIFDDIEDVQDSEYIEKEKRSSTVGVKIHNLGKTYSNGKVALTNLSLEFYKDQITSFLGHNGAGKTTTISILTGLFPATSGTATINGLDIRTQLREIRRELGVCPQYNVLFDDLTVEEHLRFYAVLKTGRTDGMRKEIDQMIEDIGLAHKRNSLSRHLSGGMKRKLSLGTAFIGNSKTVILDEPTAGVDPYSRRSIWELLSKFKEGRTIILTTHFMDEADILGDRIAIISQGQLKCCGSSIFLKQKLGSGYYLTLVKKDGTLSAQGDNLAIEQLVKEHVQNAKLVQSVGTDIVFCLPDFSSDGDRQRESFPALFDALDAKLETLGLDSYGVSDTTLEEIFLKVANDPADGEAVNELGSHEVEEMQPPWGSAPGATFEMQDSEKLIGSRLIFQQLKALYTKRFCNTKRNWKGLFSEIILPCVLVLIGEIFSLTLQVQQYDPPLNLNPWLYGDSNVAFYANRQPGEAWSNEYVTNMVNVSGMGVRCLNEEPLLGLNCSSEFTRLLNPDAVPDGYPEATCPCTLGVPDCSQNYSTNGAELFKYGSVTSDEFYDLSKKNISTWIVRTHETFKYSRSGGFEFGVHLSAPSIANLSITANENIRVWFDNKAWASSVAYLNAINNVVLRSSLPPSAGDALNYGITAINHPLEYSSNEAVGVEEVALSFAYAITVIFALCFVPASFVMFLVEERVSKAKLLQFVSGVKPITFWIAAYTWDMVYYLIPCTLIIVIFFAFGEWEYVGRQSLGGLILIFLLFGAAAIPLLYPASLVFSVPSTAFVALACANLFVGVVTTISSYVLQLFDDEKLVHVGEILDKAFLIFPHFCLGRGLIDLAEVYYTAKNYELIGVTYVRSIFEWDYLGCYFFCLFVEAVVFFLFNLSLHYEVVPEFIANRFNRNIEFSSEVEDVDVARERLRVEHDIRSTDELRILGLTKVYKGHKKPATDRISFGLRKGECFGLLGVNGAGKSTTFKMLTGDIAVTRGDAFISGHSILTDLSRAQQNLGYCPQEDAILPLLTGVEHLELFARLRGVPKKYVNKLVEHNLNKLGLQPYKDRCAGTYSGGNKRKLSTAIAFVGNPSVVFLDEPSSGMDPRARRSLWGVVVEAIKESRSVLLTSHSMEECQVLCNRLAIMVNGTLRCLGSPQHLKNRFGDGYMINVRCELESVGDVLRHVQLAIPEASLREQRSRQIIWHVKPNALAISALFKRMETVRRDSNLTDYSITQTTLDDVFVRFARLQRELHEDAVVTEGSGIYPLSSDLETTTDSVPADDNYTPL